MVNNKCGFQTEDKKCGFAMPDSMVECFHKGAETECTCYIPAEITPVAKKVIEGVGQDAEIVVNARGGKQSKSPMAMHLVDPQFLNDWFNSPNEVYLEKNNVIQDITDYMKTGDKSNLLNAVFECNCLLHSDDDENLAIVEIAKVLQYGADKYKANNWRLIPQEEHLNHALIHYLAFILGDTQDEHLEHCMCRLMMAYATEKSDKFEYGAYVA
jgi:hypothetical protein